VFSHRQRIRWVGAVAVAACHMPWAQRHFCIASYQERRGSGFYLIKSASETAFQLVSETALLLVSQCGGKKKVFKKSFLLGHLAFLV
jgi:hypothetical protein